MKNTTSKPNTNHLPIGGIPAPLKHIEAATENFAVEHRHLGSLVATLERTMATLQALQMPDIRAAVELCALTKKDVARLIDENRSLFDKPRTRVFSDIKVGLQKQKGEILFEDEEKSIALVAKHFPDRLDDLAPAKRKLSKTALANLTATELKKIGVEITADIDAVLIKPQDSDVEKAVAALLKETEPQPLKAAA